MAPSHRRIWVVALASQLAACASGTGTGTGGGAGGGTGGAGGGSAGKCPTALSVSGAMTTNIANVTFTTVDPKVSHKAGDGCIAKATFDVKATNACKLQVGFSTLEGQWGALTTLTFTATASCPGFSAASAGEYKLDNDTLVPVWYGGPRQVAASATCVTGTSVTFPDRSIDLLRFDGTRLKVNLKDLKLTGDLPSTADASLSCPSIFDVCTPMTHDDGTGTCTTAYNCIAGFHDGGGGDCVPTGTCTAGYLMGSAGDCTLWKDTFFFVVFQFVSISGSGPNDVWAGGLDAKLMHWDGTAWTQVTAPPFFGTYIASLAVLSPTNAWGVAQVGQIGHWDGTAWTNSPSSTTLSFTGVWAAAANDVWAVGGAGTVRRFNGTAWSAALSPSTGNLEAVWGSSATDVWVSGSAAVHHWNGTAWTTTALDTSFAVKRLWGTGPNDVWACASDAVFHWNGTAWTRVLFEPNGFFKAGTSVGPNDVWVIAVNRLMHWDGTSWTTHRSSERLDALWNAGPNDVWAAGRRILRKP